MLQQSLGDIHEIMLVTYILNQINYARVRFSCSLPSRSSVKFIVSHLISFRSIAFLLTGVIGLQSTINYNNTYLIAHSRKYGERVSAQLAIDRR